MVTLYRLFDGVSSVRFLRLGLRQLLVGHPLDAVAGHRQGRPLVLGRLEVLLHQLQSCKVEMKHYLMKATTACAVICNQIIWMPDEENRLNISD